MARYFEVTSAPPQLAHYVGGVGKQVNGDDGAPLLDFGFGRRQWFGWDELREVSKERYDPAQILACADMGQVQEKEQAA